MKHNCSTTACSTTGNGTSCASQGGPSPQVSKKRFGLLGVFSCPPWLTTYAISLSDWLIVAITIVDRVAHGFGCCLGF